MVSKKKKCTFSFYYYHHHYNGMNHVKKSMGFKAIFTGYLRALPAKMNSQNNDYFTIILLSEDPCAAHPQNTNPKTAPAFSNHLTRE
jgi:hypothetical protein